VSLGDDKQKKRPWYAFWKGRGKSGAGDEGFEMPDDWFTTNIRQGLSSSEIESRRRHT